MNPTEPERRRNTPRERFARAVDDVPATARTERAEQDDFAAELAVVARLRHDRQAVANLQHNSLKSSTCVSNTPPDTDHGKYHGRKMDMEMGSIVIQEISKCVQSC